MAEVLGGGELFIQAGGLKDDADTLADFLHIVGSVEAEHLDGAAAWRSKVERIRKSTVGFAAAVWAEKAEDFDRVSCREIVDGDAWPAK